jgi:transglutaminase-like putative cysteine protease
MNANPTPASNELAVRLAAFAALAVLGAWHWARLVADPPVGRVALAVAVLTVGAAAVAWIGAVPLGRVAARALAGAAALAATGVGLVAVGVPADLLVPDSWGRLGDQVGRGFAGLDGGVEYPYERGNDWSRLVLLGGLPLMLGLAAALAFWPTGRAERGSRMSGLVVLIAVYAIAATAVPPGEPLLWGLLLLVVVAAWLWLHRLNRRDAISAAALVALAGIAAVAAAGRLDAERPWIDYRDWRLAGEGGISFGWGHDYGPLDWPRTGATVLRVESEGPHYWRASVLDEFDGTRWLRPESASGADLEVPAQVEDGSDVIDRDALDPKWVETVEVALGPMRSDLVVAPGTVIGVNGLEVEPRPDGTVVTDDGPLEEGDAYTAQAYAPDPTPQQMRAAPGRYYPILAGYAEIGLPAGRDSGGGGTRVEEVGVPLWGSAAAAGDPAARRRILASPYAATYRLAHRLTTGKPNPYEAARAIEAHLRRGPYEYREAVGRAGRHPLASFLYEDRSGYCQQFSGAMALMLRMVGIPSRVATGFSAGTHEPAGGDDYLVSDFDAHSWVEVYFTGIGWVPFEPTPSVAPAASQFGEGDFVSGSDGLASGRQPGPPGRSADAATAVPSAGSGPPWTILGAGLGLAVLAVTAPATVRALRYRALSPAAAAEAQLRELRRGLTRIKLPIQPGETMLELEERLRRHLGLATAAYVAKLRRGRFEAGDHAPPTLAERRAVRREFGLRPGQTNAVRAWRAFPRGGPR